MAVARQARIEVIELGHAGVTDEEMRMLLTIDSAGKVLSLFTNDHPEHGVTEVAAAIGVSKSKAHALLSSLANVGLLRRTERGRYRVGWRVLSLNRVHTETTDFHRQAQPVMQALSRRFGELLQLATLEDGRIECIDQVKGTTAVRIAAGAFGERIPAHASALGKVMLAHLPAKLVDGLVDRHGLPAITKRTITDRATLDEELARVRRQGYATDLGEALAEVSTVAAPIFVPGPICVAVIGMAAPSHRYEVRSDIYRQGIVRAGGYITSGLSVADLDDVAEAEPAYG